VLVAVEIEEGAGARA